MTGHNLESDGFSIQLIYQPDIPSSNARLVTTRQANAQWFTDSLDIEVSDFTPIVQRETGPATQINSLLELDRRETVTVYVNNGANVKVPNLIWQIPSSGTSHQDRSLLSLVNNHAVSPNTYIISARDSTSSASVPLHVVDFDGNDILNLNFRIVDREFPTFHLKELTHTGTPVTINDTCGDSDGTTICYQNTIPIDYMLSSVATINPPHTFALFDYSGSPATPYRFNNNSVDFIHFATRTYKEESSGILSQESSALNTVLNTHYLNKLKIDNTLTTVNNESAQLILGYANSSTPISASSIDSITSVINTEIDLADPIPEFSSIFLQVNAEDRNGLVTPISEPYIHSIELSVPFVPTSIFEINPDTFAETERPNPVHVSTSQTEQYRIDIPQDYEENLHSNFSQYKLSYYGCIQQHPKSRRYTNISCWKRRYAVHITEYRKRLDLKYRSRFFCNNNTKLYI